MNEKKIQREAMLAFITGAIEDQATIDKISELIENDPATNKLYMELMSDEEDSETTESFMPELRSMIAGWPNETPVVGPEQKTLTSRLHHTPVGTLLSDSSVDSNLRSEVMLSSNRLTYVPNSNMLILHEKFEIDNQYPFRLALITVQQGDHIFQRIVPIEADAKAKEYRRELNIRILVREPASSYQLNQFSVTSLDSSFVENNSELVKRLVEEAELLDDPWVIDDEIAVGNVKKFLKLVDNR